MANYIDQNIICQAYIHVEPVNLPDEALEGYREYVKEFVEARGKFFLYPDVEIDVELKEGSLKSYATVLGTISALYAGIAQYPDFRSGVSLMYEDCKRLSESIVSESLFMARARNNEVIRVEARTGVVGSLKKAVSDIDAIAKQNGEISPKEMARRLEDVRDDILKLSDNLHSAEDKKLVAGELAKLLQETPTSPKPRPGGKDDPDSILWYRNERRQLISRLQQRAV